MTEPERDSWLRRWLDRVLEPVWNTTSRLHHQFLSILPRPDWNRVAYSLESLAAQVGRIPFVLPISMVLAAIAPGGIGTTPHLAGELFKLQTQTDLIHVPYKGAGPALSDLIAGQVDLMFDGLGSSSQHIRAGRIKALAVASKTRSAAFPNVPTAAEAGLPNYDVSTWYALWAPKGTPKEVVDRLYAETTKALNNPEMKQIWLQNGSDIPQYTPEQFAQFEHAEIKRWADVVQRSGAKID